ncbi:hypothetical protein MYAM1_001961 [Malassezia yamatoensis]|uniref:Transcription factor 25 n=1 Tax=Malassezia yamatoensis TaxID=253288 RepID=A0AAJ5YX46_9BASI|nr:hypothetical protein MYAM1_001961 [Malassezia yamatoensis]
MSGRLNRRQQRQLEELQELSVNQADVEEGTAEDIKEDSIPKATTGFAALEVADEEESDNASEVTTTSSKKKKNKKKNKKKDTSKSTAQQEPIPRKRREQTSKNVNEMSLEEMTALLNAQQPAASNPLENAMEEKKRDITPHNFLRSKLVLDPGDLDPAFELRRQFGAAAIKAYEREKNQAGMPTRAGARHRDNRGAHFNSNTRARTVLCTPKAVWPDIARTFVGLSMSTHDTDDGRVCDWEHSRAYRQAQYQFAQAVNSHDTGALMALMRVFPWHIDTLLQLSDVSRYQGDLGQASDFIDRAIFAMERSASPPFVAGLTSSSGPPQVDFLHAENRAFWLAAHRNVDLFGRRGTWRTALEWCKMLFGLDTSDPHGMLLWIDFLAIKSKQHAWLLQFLDALEKERCSTLSKHDHLDNIKARTPIDHEKQTAKEDWHGALDWSVGVCFARALALRAVEKEQKNESHQQSDAALRLAIARHPQAAALLCEKLQLTPPVPLDECDEWSAQNEAFHMLLAHLYVHRSFSLWKEPQNLKWLQTTCQDMQSVLQDAHLLGGNADETTRMGVYRHVTVADLPESMKQQFMRYFPPSVRNPPGGMDTFDPLPPLNGTRYDETYFASVGDQLRQQAPASGGQNAWEILQHLQNLGADELQQLMEYVDPETRDLLLQAHGTNGPDGDQQDPAAQRAVQPENPSGGSDDAIQSQPQDSAENLGANDDQAPNADAPGLMQRAWSALWR